MITIQNLTLQRGFKLLFDQATATIFAKQKIGMVGINGSGKSSLLAMLQHQLEPDAGVINIQANIRIGHLSQQIPNSSESALCYVMAGDQELATLQAKLRQAETSQNSPAVAELHNRLFEIDGYAAEARAAKLLTGLGFKADELQQAVNKFSGGWRMRLNLAQVLMSRSELLLLDEPTNHLDLDAILWLERWLQRYAGTVILISHDREFLDNVINRVLFIHHCKIFEYAGNYSRFEQQWAAQLALEQQLQAKQQAQIQHLTKFITRFRAKATKAKQVQSRLKLLEKMQQVSITHLESPFSFKFHSATRVSPPLIKLESVSFNYSVARQILTKINFSLNPGDRVGLLGLNGAGKSTFMQLLAGVLSPSGGSCTLNKNLRIGYFAQHQVEQLTMEESAYWHIMQLDKQVAEQQVRNYLGGFGFYGDRIFESLTSFSGGEKARLVLALLIWQRPNLLLLDEPTNHLDLAMREALTYALQDYNGAMVLISHDRYLLKATVDELYLIANQQLTPFVGDLTDYQQLASEQEEPVVVVAKSNYEQQKQVRRLEEKLNKLCLVKDEVVAQLARSDIYLEQNKSQLANSLTKLKNIKAEIALIEQKWLAIQDPDVIL